MSVVREDGPARRERLPARLPGRLQPRRHDRRGPRRGRRRLAEESASPTGYICAKVRRYPRAHVRPGADPLPAASARAARARAMFRRASWDEALELVAARMKIGPRRARRRGDPPALLRRVERLPLAGHDRRAPLLPPRHVAAAADRLRGAVGPRGARASTARCPASRYQDYAARQAHPRLGREPVGLGHPPRPVHPGGAASAARSWSSSIRGARASRTRADLHLALRPGTDLPVALAMIRWLFENGRADRAFLAEHATGADELERRARAVDDRDAPRPKSRRPGGGPRGASPGSTPTRARPRCAAAGASSATATAGRRSPRSSRCRRSPASSASAAAATRLATPGRGRRSTGWRRPAAPEPSHAA